MEQKLIGISKTLTIVFATVTVLIVAAAAQEWEEHRHINVNDFAKKEYLADQKTALNTYDWADKELGFVKMPITEAMAKVEAELAAGTWAPVVPTAEQILAVEAKILDGVTNEVLASLGDSAPTIKAGKATFKSLCTGCHGQNGEGLTGPNLTDAYWLHGSELKDNYLVLWKGVAAKGMPPWGPTLRAAGVKNLVAYLLSIRNTNAKGRAPQGTDINGAGPTDATATN